MFAIDEDLWFGETDDAVAEQNAADSLAARVGRIIGTKPFIAPGVDRKPEFPDARGFYLQPGSLFVSAKAQHHGGAGFQRGEHVKARDAST